MYWPGQYLDRLIVGDVQLNIRDGWNEMSRENSKLNGMKHLGDVGIGNLWSTTREKELGGEGGGARERRWLARIVTFINY